MIQAEALKGAVHGSLPLPWAARTQKEPPLGARSPFGQPPRRSAQLSPVQLSREQANCRCTSENAVSFLGSWSRKSSPALNWRTQTTAPRGGTLTMRSSACRHVGLVYVCFCLMVSYVTRVADSLTLSSPLTVLQCLPGPGRSLWNTCFPTDHIAAFRSSGPPDGTSALHLGPL